MAAMTMHRAKGIEFSKVVLVAGKRTPAELARLERMDPADRADAELRTRSLIYAAAARARDELRSRAPVSGGERPPPCLVAAPRVDSFPMPRVRSVIRRGHG
ncbi:hypothetical protein GCM10010201_33200 [Pilimelia columellifera subsp. columellifera]|uniref:DNA helicase n=1 Tax=Pilimelia columellifera subsp. columellifera TaxID=706583 RepID=A0ABN3NQG4_9ACTN